RGCAASTCSRRRTATRAAASSSSPGATPAPSWRRASPGTGGASSRSPRSRPRSRKRSSPWWQAKRGANDEGRPSARALKARRARSARALDGPPGDKMPKIFLVCRRELGSMCGGPLAWVLAAVFLLLTGYFFYSDLALFVLVGGANQTRGLWRFVFLDFRLVALLVVPLVTMRLFAEEPKQGTLELLWTFPVRDGEVLAGQVLAWRALCP